MFSDGDPRSNRVWFVWLANLCGLQVEILQLEQGLARARQRVGEMRKIWYQED